MFEQVFEHLSKPLPATRVNPSPLLTPTCQAHWTPFMRGTR